MSNMFDRLAASAPQNATAARVTSKGVHYEPDVQYGTHWHADTPPRTRPIPAISQYTCADLIGRKFGRLTVIGLAADYNPKKSARWVVRCACGDYETRKATAIRNPNNGEDRCQVCLHSVNVTKRYKRLGSRPLNDFIGGA
jgi:hypothetical protein